MISKKIRLLLSYDGSSLKGWQKQKNTPHTVQNYLEKALLKIFNQNIPVIGAGRTDAGVHALGQTAHFYIPKTTPCNHLLRGLNSLTPPFISCHKAWLAPKNFHAQRSALHRTYSYIIFNTKTPPALRRNHGLWHSRPIHYKKLNQMACQLIGEKDFKNFQNTGTEIKNTTRMINQAGWFWLRHGLLMFQIQGQSFLKQMVRNLVGTQLNLMSSENPVQELKNIFNSKNRPKAVVTAPAQGLFLHKISYPQSLDKICQKF